MKYEGDLVDWLQKEQHPLEDTMDFAFQMIYMAAFCEKVGFTNFDTRIENMYVKEGRIAFADLESGKFDDNINVADKHSLGVSVNVPRADKQAIKAVSSDDDNKKDRARLGVYQLGYALYTFLANGVPFQVDLSRGEHYGEPKVPPNQPMLRKGLINFLVNKLKKEGCDEETAQGILSLIGGMLVENPLDRITCLEALSRFKEIVKKNPKIKAHFDGLGYSLSQ